MSITFKWKETTITDHSVTIAYDALEGTEVWYTPSNAMGHVVNKQGDWVIEWEDGVEDTYLETAHGKTILEDCKVF